MVWWNPPIISYPDRATAERLFRIEQGIGDLFEITGNIMTALSDTQATA